MQLCLQSSPATINYVKTPGRNPQERWRDAVDRLVFWVETRGVGPLKKLKPGSPEHARLQPLVNETARQMGVKPPGLEVVKGSNRSPLFSMERSATLSTRDPKKIAGMSYTLVGDAKFMKRLDAGELKAVVRHELAHMKLNHLGIKRDARGHVVQHASSKSLSKRHEFEADAVVAQGGLGKPMARVLGKMTPARFSPTHPTRSARIDNVLKIDREVEAARKDSFAEKRPDKGVEKDTAGLGQSMERNGLGPTNRPALSAARRDAPTLRPPQPGPGVGL